MFFLLVISAFINELCVCACVRVCVFVRVQDEAQYVCVVEIEGVQLNLTAAVEKTHGNTNTFTCSPHQVTHTHSVLMLTGC